MKAPTVTSFRTLWLLCNERLPEDFLELCIIVQFLNLYQLLLCLGVLLLEHFLWLLVRLGP